MKPTSIESGMTAATSSAARTSPQEDEEDDDDEERPLEQVLRARCATVRSMTSLWS